MQTTPKANTILGHFFAVLGAAVMLAIATWVSASSSQQVQPLDNLAVPRTGHTATALSDGRILITGGRDTDGNLVAASEIFDPETQTSAASTSLNTARVDHSATVLADGRVLVTGGTGDSGALSSAEIFDPAHPENGFTAVASPMTSARTKHTATLLNNGSVLIAGGETGGTAEIFDPATQSFTPTLWNLQVARSGHTATLFTDDSVLLAGGNTASMELFTPLDQHFTLDAATMSVIRTGHWAFELSDTRLLLFQGDTGNSIDEFNPTTDTITPKGSLDFRASSSTLLANGKVLVLGTGVSGLYNPDAVPPAPDFTAFDETSVPGSSILPRSGQSAVTLPGDKQILISGGVNGTNQLLGEALFNPAKIWTDKDDYQPDEPVILSASGWKGNENIYLYAVDNETEQWTYEMTTLADANGEFVLSPYFIVELRHLGVQFHVTALGAQSTMQADVHFTDAGANSVTVGAQTPSPVIAGNSATYTVTVGFNGNGNPCTVTLNASGLPAGATATFTPNPVLGPANTTSQMTISTTGATAGGTHNFTVTGARGGNCSGGGADPTGAGTLVVTAATATTTTVTSSLNPSIYGDSVTFTATVARTSGSGTPTGNVNFTIAGIGTVAGTPGTTTPTTSTWTYTTSALTAGNHSVSASFTHSGAFQDSSGSLSGGQTVNKATPVATLSVTNSPQAYNASPQAATVSITTSSVPGTVANILTGGAATQTNAGTYAVTADFVPNDSTNYNTLTGQSAGSFIINKATPTATLAVSNSPQTYTGLGQAATVSITTSSVPGTVANILTGGAATKTNAGTYAVTADFVPTDTTNYNTLTGLSAGDFIINKANATVVVTPYTCPTTTYTGLSHTATYTINGVNGETGATIGTVDVTDTIHTHVGIYNGDQWSFTGSANYNDQSGTVDDCIAKAEATVVVTPYTCPSTTYIGTAHTATYTISGVNGENGVTVGTINVSGTTHTDAGTYNNDPWSFTGGADYNDQSGAVNDCIAKANATVVVTPYTCPATTYTGTAHAATYMITGVNGETGATVGAVDVSGSSHIPAGTYNNDPWSFTGTANYNDQNGTVNDCIAKAEATVVVTPYTCPTTTYTGLPHTATYAISGVNGETGATVGTANVTDTIHTNAGTYNNDPWSFTGGANYNDTSGTVDDCIARAEATVVVTPYTCPTTAYTGLAHTATYTISGVNGESGNTVGAINVSGTSHTNAGTYNNDPWSFTGGANYNDTSGTVDDCIAKANATVVVDPYSVTYDGSSHSATVVSITGVNGEVGATVGVVDVSNTVHTAAGTYAADYWFFTATANYNNIGNTTITDQIDKANATVVVNPYSVTYDGNSHSATVVSITGVNGEVGAAVGVVDVSNTAHTAAGTYAADYWFFTATANYNNIGNTTISDQIDKANAVVVVNPYSVTYDGNSHSATVVSITGVNGEVGAAVGVVDVSNTAHTAAGTYAADYWFFTATANYNNIANTTITDQIDKANAVVVVNPYSVTYDGNSHSATVVSITGVNGETGATVGVADVSNTAHTAAGTYAADYWFFTGTANYNNIGNTTITDTIEKANAVVVVDPYTVTYDSSAHTATVVSITGVNGETGATVGAVDVSNTSHTAAGTYVADYWFFTGTANYNNIGNTTITDTIDKANATISVTPYHVIYDANPHTATGTATGVGGVDLSGNLTLTGTTHTNAADYPTDAWSFSGGTNYNDDSGTVHDIIDKATPTATLAVSNSPVTYNGAGQSAMVSITVSSVPGTVANILTGGAAAQTNAATYAVTADFVPTDSGNYNSLPGRSAGNFVIDKATPTATLAVSNSPQIYTGSGQAATVGISVSSVPGSVANILTGGAATQTNAGTYAVLADFVPTDTANYNSLPGLSAGNFVIEKATPTATLAVDNSPVTYNGFGQAATVSISVSSVPGSVADILTGGAATQTNAGTYAVTADFVPTDSSNYNSLPALSAGNFVVQKATAVITVTGFSGVYDGAPHGVVSSSAKGVNNEDLTGLSIDPTTYTDVPGGSVHWTFTNANYNDDSGDATVTINKADATVTVNGYTGVYDAAPHGATGTATGVGGVDLSAGLNLGATFADVPGGTAHWAFTGGTNYNNQNGDASIVINKADATVTVSGYTGVYDAAPHAATGTATGVGGVDLSAGLNLGATFADVPGGTAHWAFTGGTNYNNQNGDASIVINKADATVTVSGYTGVYDAAPHGATGTATGVGGVDLSADLNSGRDLYGCSRRYGALDLQRWDQLQRPEW